MVTAENLSKAKVELSKLRLANKNNSLDQTIRALEKDIRKVENRILKKKFNSSTVDASS